MTLQTFVFNDNEQKALYVVGQTSMKFDSMSIQISKVLDFDNLVINEDNATVNFKYVYEEVNNDDLVMYCHFMSKQNILNNYKFARKLIAKEPRKPKEPKPIETTEPIEPSEKGGSRELKIIKAIEPNVEDRLRTVMAKVHDNEGEKDNDSDINNN